MNGEFELRVRERAHLIWEREGRPHDRASAHWHLATAEVAAEDAAPVAKARKRPAAKAAGAPKARAAAARATTPAKSREATD